MSGSDGVNGADRPGPIRRLMDSAANLLASVLALGRTRLELLSVEVQLEVRRTVELAIWAIVAAQAAMVGLIMAAFWVVLAFWDSHRLLAAGLVTGFFLALAAGAALVVVARLRARPRFLEGTLTELARDVDRLRGGP